MLKTRSRFVPKEKGLKMQKQRFAVAIQAALISPFSAVAQRLARANPESVGMSSERLQHLDAVMRRYIDANMLAGCVSLVARQRNSTKAIELFLRLPSSLRPALPHLLIIRGINFVSPWTGPTSPP